MESNTNTLEKSIAFDIEIKNTNNNNNNFNTPSKKKTVQQRLEERLNNQNNNNDNNNVQMTDVENKLEKAKNKRD